MVGTEVLAIYGRDQGVHRSFVCSVGQAYKDSPVDTYYNSAFAPGDHGTSGRRSS